MTEQEIQVKEVLKNLLPAMEADGGGCDLVSVQDGIVNLKFKGACLICPSIGMTMNLGITKTLKEKLPWVKEVLKVSN